MKTQAPHDTSDTCPLNRYFAYERMLIAYRNNPADNAANQAH